MPRMSTAWISGAAFLLIATAACSSGESSSTSTTGSSSQTGAGGDSASGGGTTGGDLTGGAGGGAGGAPGVSCEAGTRTGDPAGATGEKTPKNVKFNVRTPPAYDATVAAPLVVVYAPAGANESQTEAYTKLTPDALARGYLIAYVDHVVVNTQAKIDDAAAVPGLIAAKWCVDPARIYLTGHSDGGSAATVLAVTGAVAPTAIAPSAAGANGAFLNQQPCPGPLPVMVLHSKGDTLFPGFGAEAAAYWAKCNGCAQGPGAPLADGCVPYTECLGGVEVQYCEGTGAHSKWPALNAEMLDFFDRFTLAK